MHSVRYQNFSVKLILKKHVSLLQLTGKYLILRIGTNKANENYFIFNNST